MNIVCVCICGSPLSFSVCVSFSHEHLERCQQQLLIKPQVLEP